MSIIGLVLVCVCVLTAIGGIVMFLKSEEEQRDWEEKSRKRRAEWLECGCEGSIIK